MAHSQQCRAEEEEGHEEGHPSRHIDLQTNLEVIEEWEKHQPYCQRNPHRESHPAYHPVRHHFRYESSVISWLERLKSNCSGRPGRCRWRCAGKYAFQMHCWPRSSLDEAQKARGQSIELEALSALCELKTRCSDFISKEEFYGREFLRIMKGLADKYKRWNPVHPTYGAFWGMGVGVGCGIGWGPGFGPEAIGNVGAGCGFGFSVGFTLAGLGVGLPVNFLFQVPYNAAMATRGAALKLVGSSSLLSKKHFAGNGWTETAPHVSELQREASEALSGFGQQHLSVKGADFSEMKNSLPLLATSACESLRALDTQLFSSHRGLDPQSSMAGTSSAIMQLTSGQEPPVASKKSALVLITPSCINGHSYLRCLCARDTGKPNKLSGTALLSSVDYPKYATTWEAENSLIQSWLINSMTKEIVKNFLLYKIAHDVSTREKTPYSPVKNKAILFDIECFLHDFRQDNLDVTQYYNVLVRHWQLLDLYEIHQWYCDMDAQYYTMRREEKRVYKFLIGLNPIFDKIRNHILSMDPLPTLEEVFFEVKSEESRTRSTPKTYAAYDVPESSALVVAKDAHSNDHKLKNSGSPWRAYCHTKEAYRKLLRRPANMKKGQT